MDLDLVFWILVRFFGLELGFLDIGSVSWTWTLVLWILDRFLGLGLFGFLGIGCDHINYTNVLPTLPVCKSSNALYP